MDEQVEILELLRVALSNNFQIREFIPKRVYLVIFLVVAVLIGLFMIATLTIGFNQISTLIFVLGMVLCGWVILILSIYEAIVDIKSPTKTFLVPSYERLTRNKIIVESLSSKSTVLLTQVKDHLEHEIMGAEHRSKILMGSVASLGLLPAVVILYETYYLKSIVMMPGTIATFFMTFFVGMYIGSLVKSAIIMRLRTMIYLLNKTIDLRERESNNGNSE